MLVVGVGLRVCVGFFLVGVWYDDCYYLEKA